ncbi:MAG TPA: hypothetical protein VFC39_14355 [Acidobacteriaceae bacterium]|nr:hypothetical protein [Acidobacteriaceae bacterium]
MSASGQMIALPESLLQQAASQANHLGVSTEQWIEIALSERIRIEKETADFFAPYIARASGRTLGELLDQAPDRPPDPGDEFEH